MSKRRTVKQNYEHCLLFLVAIDTLQMRLNLYEVQKIIKRPLLIIVLCKFCKIIGKKFLPECIHAPTCISQYGHIVKSPPQNNVKCDTGKKLSVTLEQAKQNDIIVTGIK